MKRYAPLQNHRLSVLALSMLLSAAPVSVRAATQIVDGVRWTYTVSRGEATIGDGTDPAISTSIRSLVDIPSRLGGCPVVAIAPYAFTDCNIREVWIPGTVRTIAGSAFWCCYRLEEFFVSDDNRWFASEDGVLFSRDGKNLLVYPPSRSGSHYEIPRGVKTVDWSAFYGNRNLVSISIPPETEELGWFSFQFNFKLERINVDSRNMAFMSIDGSLFTKDGRQLIVCPKPSADHVIPYGVERIGPYAFDMAFNSNLKSVTFPDTLLSIGEGAFTGCENLSSVTIGSSLSVIGHGAFNGCDDLLSLYIPPSVTSIGPHTFEQWNGDGLRQMRLPRWFEGKTDSFGIPEDCKLVFYDVAPADATQRSIHRFYSKRYKGHFFTINETEKDELIATNPNWKYEGVAYRGFSDRVGTSVPLYRFYSKNYKGHFFTTDENELHSVLDSNSNWKYEGIAYYVYPAMVDGAVPVFRFWSKGYRHHFYTTSAKERDDLIANNPNWKYECVAFYAMPDEGGGSEETPVEGEIVALTTSARNQQWRLAHGNVVPGSLTVYLDGVRTFVDNADGTLAASGVSASGRVNYQSGAITVTFNSAAVAGRRVTASYRYSAASAAFSAAGAAERSAVQCAPWTLAAAAGAVIAVPGVTDVGGAAVETRADAPDEEDLSSPRTDASYGPLALSLSLPGGAFDAELWSAADGTVAEEKAEGAFEFPLPVSGVWHWLRVRDAADEDASDAFSLWLRAE